jgi:hypothetical protein
MARSELPFRIEGRRVWVAGHRGMVGSALVRRLAREDCEVLTVERDRVDLRRQAELEAWMHETKPEVVVLAAAQVGGIHANASRPISSTTTSPCRPTLFTPPPKSACASCCSSALPASIRGSRRSRSANRRS